MLLLLLRKQLAAAISWVHWPVNLVFMHTCCLLQPRPLPQLPAARAFRTVARLLLGPPPGLCSTEAGCSTRWRKELAVCCASRGLGTRGPHAIWHPCCLSVCLFFLLLGGGRNPAVCLSLGCLPQPLSRDRERGERQSTACVQQANDLAARGLLQGLSR